MIPDPLAFDQVDLVTGFQQCRANNATVDTLVDRNDTDKYFGRLGLWVWRRLGGLLRLRITEREYSEQ